MRYKGSRDMGSDINRRIHRDNDGKVLLPDGMDTTIKAVNRLEVTGSVPSLVVEAFSPH